MWQVAWAHPMFGNILASCSYDRKVIIWKEENGSWDKMYEYTGHESSGQLDPVWLFMKKPVLFQLPPLTFQDHRQPRNRIGLCVELIGHLFSSHSELGLLGSV